MRVSPLKVKILRTALSDKYIKYKKDTGMCTFLKNVILKTLGIQ
jgi:hypothetical protein